MNSGPRIVASTSAELFLRLEQKHFRYAVLRNYERLPHLSAAAGDHPVTDIDLVMHHQDVPAWRNLAASLAEDCGWDVLTECSHFCVSRLPEHRIEIFRFYRLSPPACLQVDLFHGFLVWSVPFENEHTMLEGRFEDPELKLTRISRSSETAFHVLQLHSLILERAPREKVARYREKVLEHRAAHRSQFRRELQCAFSSFGEKALDALDHNNLPRFQLMMRCSKAWFLGRFWSKHPVLTPRYFYERARDHWCRFMSRQCGFVLTARAPSDRDRLRLQTALDELLGKKILPTWTTRDGEQARITWADHQVMERGGIAVKWVGAPGEVLDVTLLVDRDEVVASILSRLIARHQLLYRRSAAGRPL